MNLLLAALFWILHGATAFLSAYSNDEVLDKFPHDDFQKLHAPDLYDIREAKEHEKWNYARNEIALSAYFFGVLNDFNRDLKKNPPSIPTAIVLQIPTMCMCIRYFRAAELFPSAWIATAVCVIACLLMDALAVTLYNHRFKLPEFNVAYWKKQIDEGNIAGRWDYEISEYDAVNNLLIHAHLSYLNEVKVPQVRRRIIRKFLGGIAFALVFLFWSPPEA